MSLSGKWQANNGNVDIFIVQNDKLVTVNWTQTNPYWNYAAGVVSEGHVSMSFADKSGTQFRGEITADGNRINWPNGSYWTRA